MSFTGRAWSTVVLEETGLGRDTHAHSDFSKVPAAEIEAFCFGLCKNAGVGACWSTHQLSRIKVKSLEAQLQWDRSGRVPSLADPGGEAGHPCLAEAKVVIPSIPHFVSKVES